MFVDDVDDDEDRPANFDDVGKRYDRNGSDSGSGEDADAGAEMEEAVDGDVEDEDGWEETPGLTGEGNGLGVDMG